MSKTKNYWESKKTKEYMRGLEFNFQKNPNNNPINKTSQFTYTSQFLQT